jgi:hypothetical protein
MQTLGPAPTILPEPVQVGLSEAERMIQQLRETELTAKREPAFLPPIVPGNKHREDRSAAQPSVTRPNLYAR